MHQGWARSRLLREVLERHRTILGDTEHLIDQVAMLRECRRNALHQFDLFVSEEPSTLDQNDTRVQLTFADELLQVADVQRDKDAVLLVRARKELVVGRAFEAAIANVPRVDAVGGKGDGDSRRDVFVE